MGFDCMYNGVIMDVPLISCINTWQHDCSPYMEPCSKCMHSWEISKKRFFKHFVIGKVFIHKVTLLVKFYNVTKSASHTNNRVIILSNFLCKCLSSIVSSVFFVQIYIWTFFKCLLEHSNVKIVFSQEFKYDMNFYFWENYQQISNAARLRHATTIDQSQCSWFLWIHHFLSNWNKTNFCVMKWFEFKTKTCAHIMHN